VIVGTTGIWEIAARWDNENVRQLLITAVAGTLQSVTLQGKGPGTVYFDMVGTKACNVGDVVRVSRLILLFHLPADNAQPQVNFPTTSSGNSNFFHIRIGNYWTDYGSYDCCAADGLQKIGMVIDHLETGIGKEFPAHAGDTWFRDSRCIINGWQTCSVCAE
jgi:hypothetical protein